jgi:autotransporter-associated beta strand protein
MNTLPENELFSAYLDGELTAAEQAQMDRLLAANPAARQLLDELHTLSTALQSLPQQKVGEDLGPRVLRIAERRMLTEEPPGDVKRAQFAAVPLARSIFRRFLQPRAVVWLSITAVVAAMIMLNEQRHPAPVGKADREVALAPATPKRALPPSSISAAPDALAKTTESKPAELKRENGGGWKEDKAREYLKYDERPAAAAPSVAPPAEQAAGKPAGPPPDRYWAMEKKPASGLGEAATPRPSTPAPAAETATLDAPAMPSDNSTMPSGNGTMPSGNVEKRPTFTGKTGVGALSIGGEGERAEPKLAAERGLAPAKNAPPAGKDGGRPGFYGDGIAQTEHGTVAEQTDAGKQGRHGGQIVPAVGDGVLVVRCDVSPEALNKKAFDKLLDANGIAWREEEAEEEAEKVRGTRALAEKAAGDKKSAKANLREKQQSVTGRKMRQGGGTGPLDVVYVEATPAQIEATLAGLAAQPNVFLSVSVQPAPGEASQKSLSQYNRHGEEQSKAKGGHDDSYRAKAATRLPEKAAQSGLAANDELQTLDDGRPAVDKFSYAQRIRTPGATLDKSGPGAQTLNGANTYSGSTAVNGGALKLGKKPEAKKDLGGGQTTEGVAGGLARTQPKSQPMPGGGNKAGADQSVGHRDAPAKQPAVEERGQEAKSADEQRLSQQFQARRAGDLAQTQRVLFVLRVVDGTGPAAAAARIRAAEVDASRQAAEPAAEPAQQQKAGH